MGHDSFLKPEHLEKMGTINSIDVNPLNDLICLIWFKKT